MQMHANSESAPNKPSWKVWWELTRPHTLTASFVPVLIGTALALHYGKIHIPLFLSMMAACLLIQAATNMFNEYYDYKRGIDTEHSVGIGGAIVREGVAPKTVLAIAFSLYGLAMLLGIYICGETSWWLCLIGLIGMAVGYLYTGGPYPISATPFGEIFAGFFMGMLFILISFYIQTGEVTMLSVLISLPITLLVGAILLSNSIRDIDEDTLGGRKTLAILVGKKNAIYVLASMFIMAYAIITVLVIMQRVSPWLLLVYLSIALPIKSIKIFSAGQTPKEMAPAMGATAKTNTIFGFLQALGLLISYFI